MSTTITSFKGLGHFSVGDVIRVSGSEYGIAADGGLVRGRWQPPKLYRVTSIESESCVTVEPYSRLRWALDWLTWQPFRLIRWVLVKLRIIWSD